MSRYVNHPPELKIIQTYMNNRDKTKFTNYGWLLLPTALQGRLEHAYAFPGHDEVWWW